MIRLLHMMEIEVLRLESVRQRPPDEPDTKSKVWERWEEDESMLYFTSHTKAARERLRAAQEESSSNVKAWAQDVVKY
jgi:hypothetical protein